MPDLGPMFSRNISSRPGPEDLELWARVDELWGKSGLGPDDSLSLERSNPLVREIFRQQMTKANLSVEASDEILMQIFN